MTTELLDDTVTLNDALGLTPSEKPTVTFGTRRDVGLVVQALTARTDDLDKLAKKAEDEGYAREARSVRDDLETIKQQILPQFRGQTELPLESAQSVQAAIANALRSVVRKRMHVTVQAEDEQRAGGSVYQTDAFKSAETYLLEELARRIEPALTEAVEIGYQAGYAARESQPHVLAKKASEALWRGGND